MYVHFPDSLGTILFGDFIVGDNKGNKAIDRAKTRRRGYMPDDKLVKRHKAKTPVARIGGLASIEKNHQPSRLVSSVKKTFITPAPARRDFTVKLSPKTLRDNFLQQTFCPQLRTRVKNEEWTAAAQLATIKMAKYLVYGFGDFDTLRAEFTDAEFDIIMSEFAIAAWIDRVALHNLPLRGMQHPLFIHKATIVAKEFGKVSA